MFFRCLILVLVSHSISTHAAYKWNVNFDLAVNAQYVEGQTQQARNFGIAPAANVNVQLFENLSFKARASALLETGSYKGTLLDEFKPDQQVVLNHAYFHYLPWQSMQTQLGAIPMKGWTPDMLISSTRFLGANAIQKISLWADAALELKALAAIPTNQELTNRLGTVSEGTPSYWQAGVGLDLPGDILGINAQAFAWGYSDITNNVAYQSSFMGNQTTGFGSNNTRLAYAFKGFTGVLDFNGQLGGIKYGIGGDYIFNDGAPDSRNQAMRSRATLGFGAHKNIFSWFKIESDAAIGYYNSSILGHTNRDGISYEYIYQDTKESSFGLTAVHSKTIRTTLLQADQDAINVWWRLELL